jgi:hypothetical protein
MQLWGSLALEYKEKRKRRRECTYIGERKAVRHGRRQGRDNILLQSKSAHGYKTPDYMRNVIAMIDD